MPEASLDWEGANALYDALTKWRYHTTVETTVFLDFEDRATIGLTFGDHIEGAEITRRGDDTYKVSLGDSRLAVYPPGATGEARVSVSIDGEGVCNPTDVRLSKGVRFR